MVLPDNLLAATTERFEERTAERAEVEQKLDEVKAGRASVLEVDSPERVALRGQRVAARDTLDASPVPATESPEVLERIIDGSNLLAVAFLELGARVASTVGRINVRDQVQLRGFGTGFLAAPRVLMTNNHVLSDAGEARFSQVEFDLQNDIDGRPRPTYSFDLLPDELFLTNRELDVTMVAVAPRSRADSTAPQRDLADFGSNRLSRLQGKILLGESINIIQHPEGQPKQLALQQNELVDRFDAFLHYRSDTSPGSSGSPLFNNQWEVLGLHHSGVPAKDAQGRILAVDGSVWDRSMGDDKIKWIANEGIRISSVISFAETEAPNLPPAARDLLRLVIDPGPETTPITPLPAGVGIIPVPAPPSPATLVGSTETPAAATTTSVVAAAPTAVAPQAPAGTADVTVTVPLRITVQLAGQSAAAVTQAAPVAAPALVEAVSIDPDYTTRAGYDPEFTGLTVPLPELTAQQREQVAMNQQPLPGRDPAVLDYHHYSLVMHRGRRIAWYSVVNIEGALSMELNRDRDKWIFDPRIDREAQMGPEIYEDNDFDRGHLVRRLDPAWGSVEKIARVANDDTFHFTNCSPQHKFFNQGKTLWAGLEDHLLHGARAAKQRITVFNGPVLKPADPIFRGVQIPLAYWKVVAFRTAEGKGASAAFLISQKELVEKELEAAFAPETFQVPVRSIASLTSLDFSHLREFDSLDGEREESDVVEESTDLPLPGVRLGSYDDLRL
ncbi:DNA/RNA non-specific endonuclease [Nocardioides speluncae]|uniref:DNA/RNA non-specific endonuclease n=1 Tax=Nocardioides speluncae TaxID=2670337 RepID=UPI000D6923EC|nr:DNA/RNA non-specific endonuclease [Nocardioides speluncae]